MILTPGRSDPAGQIFLTAFVCHITEIVKRKEEEKCFL